MRTFLKSQIRLTKNQRIGIFVLLVILFAVEGFDVFVNRSYEDAAYEEMHWDEIEKLDQVKQPEIRLLEEDAYAIEVLTEGERSKRSVAKITLLEEEEVHDRSNLVQLTPFDPNQFTQKDWESIGFTSFQAKEILVYKKLLGGEFRSLDQLKSCVAISQEQFEKIAPFLLLEKKQQESKSEMRLLDEEDKMPEKSSSSIQVLED